jgi:hypothetical protein
MRKFTLLFAALFVFTSLSYSQNFATKGTIEAGGSLGFSSSTSVSNGESASNSTTTIRLEPYIGYFVVNSFELGFEPSFTTSSYGDYSSTSFGIYFAPAWNFDLRSNLFPFLEGRIGYNTSSQDVPSVLGTTEYTASGIAWGARGGVKVKIGNSGLFNLALSYDQITMNPKDWSGSRNGENIFAVNAGFTVFFGR